MLEKKQQKILVIVLDGATFDILNPLIKKNKLPNLTNMIKNGVRAPLISVFPPVTPVAWASFATGKNPGKHGIMDFVTQQQDSYDRTIVNATNIKGETLWSILSQAKKKVGLLHVPLLTNPPERVNGFIVSGHPFLSLFSTYPKELKEEILNEVPGYNTIYSDIRRAHYIPGTEDSYIESIHYALKNVADVTFYMLEKKEWDFLITQFFFGDPIQHVFWKYLDPQHPFFDHNEAKKYGKTIENYYHHVDTIIGRILEKIEKETTVIVMSDHGFGPLYKEVYINQWLEKIGLLRTKENPKIKPSNILSKFGITLELVTKLLEENSYLRSLEELIPIKLLRIIKEKLPAHTQLTFKDIDFEKTKAYSYGHVGQIFINLKERDPKGIVKPEEYEDLRDYITNELLKLEDPENRTKIVDQVFKKEELYHGQQLKKAADLLFIMKDISYITPFSIREPKEFGNRTDSLVGNPSPEFISGWHRMDGILIMTGPQLNKNYRLKTAKIIDLAPTLLHIANVPIPTDMDGRVLTQIFKEKSYLATKETTYQVLEKHQKDEYYTPKKEKEEIMERLRALGYLS